MFNFVTYFIKHFINTKNIAIMTAIEFSHELISLKSNLEYYAYSLTTDKEKAKDLLQDTILKALTYRDKFEANTNLKAWAYTIMKNTFINAYRRNIKANTIIDTTEDLYYINNPKVSEYVKPDSEYIYKELTGFVKELEPEQRVPFEMHVEGYKYKEIAEELGLSIGTVKSRIFFARKKLMERLRSYSN